MLSFIKSVILFVLVSFQALAFQPNVSQLVPYYGEDFYNQLRTGVGNEDLVLKIKEVLRSYHVRQGNKPDLITRDCQGQKGCYSHVSVGYGRARIFLLGQFYLVQQGNGYGIKEVYCDRIYTERDFGGSKPGPNKVPDNKIMNVEHTWPQSRFSGRHRDDLQKADLHHLYPTDSQMNSIRGNLRFGEVVTDRKELKCDSGARFGSDGKRGSDVFEPPANHTGNVARALFYFSLRYDLPIDSDEETVLRKWSKEDPIDEEESRRNHEIYLAQGNRNPFIDFPSLEERISDF